MEHYTKAASQLCITQPSLSYAISSLEDELGVKLFEKCGRNVTLTRSGKAFLRDVEEILSRLDASTANLKTVETDKGTIELAFVRELGDDFVPGVISGFLADNTSSRVRINLNYTQNVTADIMKGLKEKRYDIAFCQRLNNEPMIEFIPVIKRDLIVVMAKGHALAAKLNLRLEDILPYPQIMLDKTSAVRSVINCFYNSINAVPEIAYEVADERMAAGFAANGLGVCILPEIPMLSAFDVDVRPLISPSCAQVFYMAVLKGRYLTPAVENFREYVIGLES